MADYGGLSIEASEVGSARAPGRASERAALLGLNAVFHIVLVIQTGAYMPGLVTALLFTLPVSTTLLVRARHQRWVLAGVFWAALAAGVVIHGPVLDALFRMSLELMRA